jgi:hypothetical protein
VCPTHHNKFDTYDFFIRFVPEVSPILWYFPIRLCTHQKQTRKFVFVNYSDDLEAVGPDVGDRHAPFPSLFIIHEVRARGFHPFAPVSPTADDDGAWQDWIMAGGVFDSETNPFKRERPRRSRRNISPQQLPQLQMISAGGASSDGRSMALNAGVISEILAATYAMPSWKACEIEGTSWTGTAGENIQKYVSTFGGEGS